jgi:glycosyltransferase involved in cell wall biosynthesis
MRILFVHQNFPGQYPHIALALKARGHDVAALTIATNKRSEMIKFYRYDYTKSVDKRTQATLAGHYTEHTERGHAVAKAAAGLKAQGYRPDIICGHLGWGETLFLKDVWPDAKLIVYAEFFYRNHGLDVGFDPEFPLAGFEPRLRVTARQAALLLAMHGADYAQAPTDWQAKSFPAELQSKIQVVHDGINTRLIAPNAHAQIRLGTDTKIVLKPGDEVLTFINRNLEPYRGYHTFMRALPEIMRRRPNVRVIIVGGNEVSYGAAAPPGQSWREIFLSEVRAKLDMSRIHYVGLIPHSVFINLMQVTRVHAYLTYPFVLSWSMLEAMSAGALIVGSNTPPVAEVIRHGENGRLVDFFDVKGWSEALVQALAAPDQALHLREAARQTAIARYDLDTICLPAQIRMIESLG